MIRNILLDIEGTSTSISFVHDTLFPYSLAHLSDFLHANNRRPDVVEILKQIEGDSSLPNVGHFNGLQEMIDLLLEFIRKDVKYGPLKSLQGMLWKTGYEEQRFRGHVYPEVRNCFESWNQRGLKLAIYSSGSVEAQKLLFRYSQAGDLTPLIQSYFDTKVGPKQSTASYAAIADALMVKPHTILFLSDVYEELEAAEAAGLAVCQIVRGSVKKPYLRQARDFIEVERWIQG